MWSRRPGTGIPKLVLAIFSLDFENSACYAEKFAPLVCVTTYQTGQGNFGGGDAPLS